MPSAELNPGFQLGRNLVQLEQVRLEGLVAEDHPERDDDVVAHLSEPMAQKLAFGLSHHAGNALDPFAEQWPHAPKQAEAA